jgi:Transglycosylase SLT domain
MTKLQRLRGIRDASARSINMFMRDVGNGLLEISHNSLALVGLAVVLTLVFVAGRADLRHQAEVWALGWLQERHEIRAEESDDITVATAEPEAVSRATAVHPSELTRQQAAVAKWISRRYNVALEPIGRLVQEAWAIGQRAGLDPTLILAIAAIESRFNPFAQSAVGAQGLMQVMTRVHGTGAARVHCPRRRAGGRLALVRGRGQPRGRRRLPGQGAHRTGAPAARGRRQGRADEHTHRPAEAHRGAARSLCRGAGHAVAHAGPSRNGGRTGERTGCRSALTHLHGPARRRRAGTLAACATGDSAIGPARRPWPRWNTTGKRRGRLHAEPVKPFAWAALDRHV